MTEEEDLRLLRHLVSCRDRHCHLCTLYMILRLEDPPIFND